jgi:hypothetical protein
VGADPQAQVVTKLLRGLRVVADDAWVGADFGLGEDYAEIHGAYLAIAG